MGRSSMQQNHKAFPKLAEAFWKMVHDNGGTAGRTFQGIADPHADIMRLLDECLGAEGVYFEELQKVEDWLQTLSEEELELFIGGEETEVQAFFADKAPTF